MKRSGKSKGFTITEVIVTFGVILVVAAIAAPQVTRAIRTYRLNGAATDVANMIQRARYEAIRRNVITRARAMQDPSGQWQVWVDNDNDGAIDTDEPFIFLPADMSFMAAGNVPPVGSMGYTNVQQPANNAIAFDSRGTVDFGVGGAPAVLVVFLGIPTDTSYGYRAIALTPSGKTRVWRASSGQSSYWE
jgi:Tfp pilus assembly protein FimT